MKSENLITELEQVASGDAWYGSNVVAILEQVNISHMHTRLPGVHTIAEILLHVIGWNEEVNQRLLGKPAGLPVRGDWPDASAHSWIELIGLFKLSCEHLQNTIATIKEEIWNMPITDKREPGLGTGVTHEGLVKGLTQHIIYHSGQIAFITKQLQNI